jgi:hypothetical protein
MGRSDIYQDLWYVCFFGPDLKEFEPCLRVPVIYFPFFKFPFSRKITPRKLNIPVIRHLPTLSSRII